MKSSAIFAALAFLALVPVIALGVEPVIAVTNNHSFPVNQPILVRGVRVDASQPMAQQMGDDVVVVANVPARESKRPLEMQRPAESFIAPILTPKAGGM